MDTSLSFAAERDTQDSLATFRDKFHIPKTEDGSDIIYLCGNSLGLMPKATAAYIEQELEDWKNMGVEGHMHAKNPWMPYHEILAEKMAAVVGCLPSEVVVMNGLTVNLHLLMVSFYRPDKTRYKILTDYSPFPSDRYAIASQIQFHGYDAAEGIIELQPSDHRGTVRMEQIEEVLHSHGHEISLIMIGGVNYYTGQAYPIRKITELGHRHGCMVGFDLAHAAGNLALQLHDDGPDFAAWCNYKYLNSGPGALSGCFVHERHHKSVDIPRFTGWWGHDKQTRFKMGDNFVPIPTAEAWQLSNPPIFQMAAINASLDIFTEVGMRRLREKSEQLTGYLEALIQAAQSPYIDIITPADPNQRGCQLSIRMKNGDKSLFTWLTEHHVVADWREPDVIRVAPVPLYNTFSDVWHFNRLLHEGLQQLYS